VKEEVSYVFLRPTEVTTTRVIRPTGAQSVICVNLMMMSLPKEGSAAGGGEIFPDVVGK